MIRVEREPAASKVRLELLHGEAGRSELQQEGGVVLLVRSQPAADEADRALAAGGVLLKEGRPETALIGVVTLRGVGVEVVEAVRAVIRQSIERTGSPGR